MKPAETSSARELLCKQWLFLDSSSVGIWDDVVTARNIIATIEELLEAMFSVNSVETTKSSLQLANSQS
jgi:hypothetical protein